MEHIKKGDGLIFKNPLPNWKVYEGVIYTALCDSFSTVTSTEQQVFILNNAGEKEQYSVQHFLPAIIKNNTMKESLYVSPEKVKEYYNHPNVCTQVQEEIRRKFDLFTHKTHFEVDVEWLKEKYAEAKPRLKERMEEDFPHIFATYSPYKKLFSEEHVKGGLKCIEDFLYTKLSSEYYNKIGGDTTTEKAKTILNLIYDTYK